MEILFLLLGFLFFVKGCAGHTLYGEVGGTVVFPCKSTRENIKFIYFQGGPDLTDFIIGYHNKKNLTGPKRLHTKLSLENKTVTFWNLTVLDEGTYKCLVGYEVGGGNTDDTTTRLILIEPPPTPSIKIQPLCDVSCALRCTADTQDLGPVSYEWKEDEGEWTNGDELKNISRSDTPEKFFCRLRTRVRTSDTSLAMENPLYKPPGPAEGSYEGAGMNIGIIIAILCILCIVALLAVIALVKCFCNQQRPQSVPQADPVPATEEVAVAEELEMETCR
ncbi:cell surface A33 antigen-like isoform X4 [Gadus morhua]|uniref:cell surface A33 antigen-like isoform X4 n=1 Tax=Gadus morhua TaxID=8049 RepID=UPI0011B6AD9C|nr:cell surface A33 antigen-like isoform X4 [Gadus morhua]